MGCKMVMSENTMNLIDYFLGRHKEESNCFISIEAYCDKRKREGQVAGKFFEMSKSNTQDIIDYVKKINVDSNGVYINVNPLNKPRRKVKVPEGQIPDISRIKFIFIDIDENPNKEELSNLA